MTKYAIGRHSAGPMETLAQRILDAERRAREERLKNQKDKNQTDLTIEGKTDSTPTEELKIDSQPTGQSYAINRAEGPMETLVERIRMQEAEERRRKSGSKGGKKGSSGTGKGAGGPNTGGSNAGEANL